MIALGHSSVGAIIGVSTAVATPGWPWWLRALTVYLLATASHYPSDWIPHGHYHMRFKNIPISMLLLGLADIVGFVLILLGLAWWSFGFGATFWLIGVGIVGALTPDIWESLNQLGFIPQWRWVRAHRHFHLKTMHWHSKPAGPHVRLARPLQLTDIWLVGVFAAAVWFLS